MNFKKLLLLFVITLTAISCKNDDDGVAEREFNNENLAGLYNITFYETREVQTINVNGLDVVTTITEDGSTFQAQVNFSVNGTATLDGQFLIDYKVVVNGETTQENAEIVDFDNETSSFSTTASPKLLTLGGDTYEVVLFNENELRIILEETTTSNDETVVYEEEFRFVKN